jgi:hypothetical protein
MGMWWGRVEGKVDEATNEAKLAMTLRQHAAMVSGAPSRGRVAAVQSAPVVVCVGVFVSSK